MTSSNNPEITPEIALTWFDDAVKRGPKPQASDLGNLVDLANSIGLYSSRQLHIVYLPPSKLTNFDVLNDEEFEITRSLQQPLKKLLEGLPAVTQAFKNNDLGPRTIKKLEALQKALVALDSEAPYLFTAPAPGGRDRDWHVCAWILRLPIELVLRRIGRTRISAKPDGPLVKVLEAALKDLGRDICKSAISTELKRAKRREGFTDNLYY
jgi:hypothetical protein